MMKDLDIRKCPKCGKISGKVVDSRPTDDGNITRRRACEFCGTRWTTIEMFKYGTNHKKYKLSMESIIDVLFLMYGKAVSNRQIQKPLSWALYKTWEKVDKAERSRYE